MACRGGYLHALASRDSRCDVRLQPCRLVVDETAKEETAKRARSGESAADREIGLRWEGELVATLDLELENRSFTYRYARGSAL